MKPWRAGSAGLGIGFALALALPALAHHSTAMFDADKLIPMQGVVKDFQYTNPHSWLLAVVDGPDGKPVLWAFEMGGPAMLIRQGIYKSSLKPGDKVTIYANPMRDGRPGGNLKKVVRADGTVVGN